MAERKAVTVTVTHWVTIMLVTWCATSKQRNGHYQPNIVVARPDLRDRINFLILLSLSSINALHIGLIMGPSAVETTVMHNVYPSITIIRSSVYFHRSSSLCKMRPRRVYGGHCCKTSTLLVRKCWPSNQ